MIEHRCTLSKDMIEMIIRIGQCKEKLSQLINNEIFDSHKLSKHSPYWDSESSVEADKLDDCRLKFSMIQDNLLDAMALLDQPEVCI